MSTESANLVPITALSTELLATSAVHYYASLLKDLSSARKSIDFEVYTFRSDKIGLQFATALAEAANRGVQVRVLLDGVGSSHFGGKAFEILTHAGAAIKIYHPFPWHFWHWQLSTIRKPLFQKIIFFFMSMNRRNHRKLIIIDCSTAWVGSFNITRQHLPAEFSGENWRDSAVRIQDDRVKPLHDSFDNIWSGKKQKEWAHDPGLRFSLNRVSKKHLHKGLLDRLESVSKRIWITNAYFLPDIKLLQILRKKAYAGVDVRVILPGMSDVFFMPWVSSVFYELLIQAGVKIFEYQPGILHAKTIILDDWMTVGSSNLNQRSLRHDLELDVVLLTEDSKKSLIEHFEADLKQSVQIHRGKKSWGRWFKRFFGKFFLIVRYFL